jgi:hypothetical protein
MYQFKSLFVHQELLLLHLAAEVQKMTPPQKRLVDLMLVKQSIICTVQNLFLALYWHPNFTLRVVQNLISTTLLGRSLLKPALTEAFATTERLSVFQNISFFHGG